RHASKLFAAAADDVGADWACDLFFYADRDYWQRRNRAGAVQYDRQNRLGLGWANHDHHTYRSSRAAFPHLIAFLEQMGFQCRERRTATDRTEPTAAAVVFVEPVRPRPDEVAGVFPLNALRQHDHPGRFGLPPTPAGTFSLDVTTDLRQWQPYGGTCIPDAQC